MKNYIKPAMQCVVLDAEENIMANPSTPGVNPEVPGSGNPQLAPKANFDDED